MSFEDILKKYRDISFSLRDQGERFERLMKAYLLTDPRYSTIFKNVWMWDEFEYKDQFGGKDIGIDLVALTKDNDYWAIQCKFYDQKTSIDKKQIDTFLSTSSKSFIIDNQKICFSQRLWISTGNSWSSTADEAVKNQNPPFSRLNISDLIQASVDWDKLAKGITGEQARNPKKELREHQIQALNQTHEYFKNSDRGKLIMACGTGKTFTSLRIAENETNSKGLVLFLVPSIALLGQTLREWASDAKEPIKPICICSDPRITKKTNKNADSDNTSIIDLAMPASTDINNISKQFKQIINSKDNGLKVVFSTYQSIDVISKVQKILLEDKIDVVFDLIICDEAHRTTGVTLDGNDESSFVKVHNNNFIMAKKRLYMTATPKLYSDDSKSKAAQNDAIICSMDDNNLYGEEIYRIGFGEAVEKNLLTDYKVLVLTINDRDVPLSLQESISKNKEIKTDDLAKLIGCINAISKQILGNEELIKASDPNPMKRAVAFCQSIETSKNITKVFNDLSNDYIELLEKKKKEKIVKIHSNHIDGSMSAPKRDELLSWLKSDDINQNECKLLTNVKCLSEGVDVPSLDAVIFLSAKNSQVDVVQSVGRVMRRSENKKYGYIIIPVVVPSNEDASKALDDNERFKVVWTVLNALRAHDDRFNATINKIELNKNKPKQILIGGIDNNDDDENTGENNNSIQNDFDQKMFHFEELKEAIYAKMVIKVGDRVYWEKWAKDVALITQRQIEQISELVKNEKYKATFNSFLIGLQKNINPSITQIQAIEMLSQHIITKPIFEALFENYSFVRNNPVSNSMQDILNILEEQKNEKDFEALQKFYNSIKTRIDKIDNASGKQKIILELYDKFFKIAFPKMVDQLGIVYTPVEVVDFIIHSVNDILKTEFGRSLSDENIHILDPFTGTGTFITRLIQSGIISHESLLKKYKNEFHANEIVLLAYYIATVNIENALHDELQLNEYTPFDGIVLTDTFQLGESDDIFSSVFEKNSQRAIKQKQTPLKVIIGNPPYSVGQKSANDNAQNQKYEKLDNRIALTYAYNSNAKNKNSLYDAYIKAFRWSSDRLDKDGGVIAFVSNGAWLDGNSQDGFRKCLEKEFSSIWVFNLRGNQRTSGELSRKEGGKIFGSGSRTPISITLLVKNPDVKKEKATIYYHDIGDYLNREEKLKRISNFKSISNIQWQILNPNKHGDWINQRGDLFGEFIPLNPEKKFDKISQSFFILNSIGVGTGRDTWVYNSSKSNLIANMKETIGFYNSQVSEFLIEKKQNPKTNVDDFINRNSLKISWSSSLIPKVESGIFANFSKDKILSSLYRPFFKQFLYFGEPFIHRRGQFDSIFANTNLSINISSTNKGFSVLIANLISDIHFNGDTQCFPLYYYEEVDKKSQNLFDQTKEDKKDYIRRDGISDFILDRARKQYGANNITKEDIFYYVYGFLHSKDYKEKFANELKKMLPRLSLVESVEDFWHFSKAGRKLANLHINYETVKPLDSVVVKGHDSNFFKVEKMKFISKNQKDTIIFNSKITISNIPQKAYEYIVNGKSAIEWVMERYQITTNKESGIKNDPNDWADEVKNPQYILDLILSIITVSVESVDIINNLPKIKFE